MATPPLRIMTMKSRFLFTLCSLFGLSPAFGSVILTVNTTNDEFGENIANCSLREAVESINTYSAFGGCIAGKRYSTNIIRLEDKEYILNRGELTLVTEMTISGVGVNADEKDSITGTKPKRHAPTTMINGQGKSRLFNSAIYKSALTLNNLKLLNGYSEDLGGAILAGGSVSTSNVVFENNIAKNEGGALYLIGKDSALTTVDSLWQNNNIIQGAGAAIAMSCLDDLKPTTRTIEIIQSSIVLNGNISSNSVIEACGVITLNIKTSTIGENTANDSGAIINLNNNTSAFSSINIESSTLVKNKVAPIINFDKANNIATRYSVIAFNENQNCLGINNANINYLASFNFIEKCDYLNVPYLDNTVQNNVFLPSPLPIQFENEFNLLGNYGGFTPTYLPKTTSKYILDKGGACIDRVDQRASTYSDAIICDLGSVERRIAMAVVNRDSVITNNKTTDRSIEISVLDNDIPSETDLTDDQPNARGQIAKDAEGNYLIELTNNNNGLCTIVQRNADNLLPLIRFDNGGKTLTDTQQASCKYTFTDSNGKKALEGELLFRVQNKPPKAGNDTFTLASESSSLVMNVVNNDNDDDDGQYGGLCTSNTVKCNGGYYIRVVSSPSLGTIDGDRRECPDFNETNKFLCYRGDLIYHPKNTLSPFNDSFTYVVYDTDLDISAPATVTIINQAGQNEEQNSGSLGWGSLLVLAGFTVYRRRKYRFV